MSNSHRAVIKDIAEKYRLRQAFVIAVAQAKDERQKTTLLHGLAGKTPDKTGRKLCQFCECRLSDPACDRFRAATDQDVTRILDEYVGIFCPECKRKMEGYKPVEVIDHEQEAEWGGIKETPPTPEPQTYTTERKTKVEPCGCVLDEPKKIGAVDRDALNAAGQRGELVYGYEAEVTRGIDPLQEADDAE